VDGTERLVSPACALATVMAQLPASTSSAWKAQTVQAMLGFISRLEFSRGEAAGTATAAGICTLIKEMGGGYTFEAFVNTAAPVAPTKKNGTRTRMGIFIAKSIKLSLRQNVDAPNLPVTQRDVVGAVQTFMDGLLANASTNALGLEHVAAWGWGDFAQANLAADVANGFFTLPLDVTTSSQMEKILLSIQYGENVVVKLAA
jgi:phage tail sheath protein FI